MTPPPAGADPLTAAVERSAEEMAARWAGGDRPLAEEYLDRFPALWARPAAALELVAEELALRAEYRLPADPAELAGRFPRWAAQVRALVDCQEVLGPPAGPAWPAPGDWLGEFRLGAELGRGAHGRVYRATQPALAGRSVVLKVAPAAGVEHLSLARLQHTHIVPLYSAHEFPDRGLRALCLPDFGGATLAAVGARVRAPGRPATGAALAAALGPGGAGGADRAFLERAALPDAVCRVGAWLADALQYAHDRGLVHLDVKPSNVLVAADGTPMLLDFHLARPPVPAGDPAPGWFGGTPGYMAPEHEAAVAAVRAGRPVPAPVDGRADVFSLGVLLGEFLRDCGGRPTPGLADVFARSTAPDPAARYPSAGDLAADLRRHLADLPLRGVGNRSLRERWGKWRRRRPLALPLALALAALAVGLGAAGGHAGRLADRGRAALRDGHAHAADGRYAEAAEAFRGGEAAADGLPFHAALRADLRAGRAAADRAVAADDLHAVAERVRWLAAADLVPPDQARAAGRRCRELWANREPLAAKLAGQPTPDRDDRWRADLLDLAVLAADLSVRAAGPDDPAARRQALATLAEAERLFGPTGAVDLERARHARALGMTAEADAARRADARPRRTAWDHVLAGRALLAAGAVDRAAAEFDAALARDPRAVWANHFRGVTLLRVGRPAEAAVAFGACVALAPDVAWCAANRGVAYSAAGLPGPALADFDRAIALDPSLAAGYLGRAAVHHAAGRPADALADLGRAEGCGTPPAEVRYRAAVVRLAAGDRNEAAADLRDGLAADPAHAGARALLARLAVGP